MTQKTRSMAEMQEIAESRGLVTADSGIFEIAMGGVSGAGGIAATLQFIDLLICCSASE